VQNGRILTDFLSIWSIVQALYFKGEGHEIGPIPN